MFSTIVRSLPSLRGSLCGLAIAGLLLGVPFTSNPGSQCQAAGKGGGHHSKGHSGHKARNKRHGPKRHHAGRHAAMKHRHARRREHVAHGPHRDLGHNWHGGPGGVWHHGNPWHHFWGNGYEGADFGYDGPVVVNPGVVGPTTIVGPTTVVDKVFVVTFYTAKSGKDHVEEIVAPSREKAKEKVLEKHPRADIKSIEEKLVISGH